MAKLYNDTALTKENLINAKKFRYRSKWAGYLMLLPAFAILVTFVIVPLVMAFIRSFQDYNTGNFILFDNYRYVLTTAAFTQSFVNVLIMTAIMTALLALCFLFAIVLKCLRKFAIGNVTKTIVFLPFLISGVIVSIVFLFMLNYRFGIFNAIRIKLDLDPIAFGAEGFWPYISIIVPSFWLGFGYNSLVLFAGLINIPKEYYEAAGIDGASSLRQLFSITIPNMKNYFVLVIISSVTGNLQMLDIPLMMTQGGPQGTTTTPALYLFNTFRDPNRPANVTLAGAILIMILIAAINSVVFRVMKAEKSKDD